MSYKLELNGCVHLDVLGSTLQSWSCAQPDLFIISQEGQRIYAQSSILNFYSPMLMELLATNSLSVGISLEASSNSIRSLLEVLTFGTAFTKEKGNLAEAVKTAELLGISIDNWQIGRRKEKPVISETGTGIETRSKRLTSTPKMKELERIGRIGKINNINKFKIKIKHATKLGKSSWSCDICGHETRDSTTIQKHVKTHSKNHRIKCQRCSFTFKNAKSLKNHISIAHSDSNNEKFKNEPKEKKLWTKNNKGWSCYICGYGAASKKKQVLEHIKTHSKAHSHSCHLCSYTFKNHKSLQKHMIIFHGNANPLYNLMMENEENWQDNYSGTKDPSCYESTNNITPITMDRNSKVGEAEKSSIVVMLNGNPSQEDAFEESRMNEDKNGGDEAEFDPLAAAADEAVESREIEEDVEQVEHTEGEIMGV